MRGWRALTFISKCILSDYRVEGSIYSLNAITCIHDALNAFSRALNSGRDSVDQAVELR